MSFRPGRRLLAVAASVALALSLAACTKDEAGGVTEDGLLQLRVGVFPGVLDYALESLAADDQFGFFKKNGLEVELVGINGGPNLAAALTGGSIDVADIPVSTSFPLAQRGVDIKVLMNAVNVNFDLIQQKSLPSEGVSDRDQLVALSGKTIGVASVGGGNWFWIRHVLDSVGVDPDSVTYVAVGGNETGVAAFAEKRVDAMVVYPPVLQQIDPSTYNFVASSLTHLGGPAFEGYVNLAYTTTDGFLSKNTATIDKFCTSIKDARDYLLDPANTDTVVTFLAGYTGLSADVAGDIFESYKSIWDLALPKSRWEVGRPLLAEQLENYYPDYDQYVYPGCAAA